MFIKIVKIVRWPITKVYSIVKGIDEGLEAPKKIGDAANRAFVYGTKVTGATTGVAGVAKGASDAIDALACQDGVCFVISCVGTAADSLQIVASFVPGPNVTALVTTPVSVGCKVFVYCCKRSRVPWARLC